jgi:hypothetical protein
MKYFLKILGFWDYYAAKMITSRLGVLFFKANLYIVFICTLVLFAL